MRCFCFLFFSLSVFSLPRDTVPPTGRLVDPKPLSVISNNVILFSAQARDDESGIREVRFFARWADYVETNLLGDFQMVGQVSKAPFVFYWDCSKIPDQDSFRMMFFCQIEDSAGNILDTAGGINRYVVLDRKSEISQQISRSLRTETPPRPDGSLDDWPDSLVTTFQNGNNTIRFQSVWNDTALFLGVHVFDSQLWIYPENNEEIYLNVGLTFQVFDCVQFFFDLKNDKTPFKRMDDRQLDVGVGDTLFGSIADHPTKSYEPWANNIPFKTRYFGTFNNNTDSDSGYVMEVVIPWKTLGTHPVKTDRIGFDVFNGDQDFSGGHKLSLGWSGTERYNNNNPTEWGTLVFEGRQGPGKKHWVWLGILGLVAFSGAALAFRQKSKKAAAPAPAAPQTRSGQVADSVVAYLQENFHRAELDLSTMAADLNMSAGHLKASLKKGTGKTFTDWLRDIRLEKARGMLISEKTKNVTQVALDCGFNSLEYFIFSFKKSHGGKTPSQFRAENR